jgi:hypothetical protein
MDLPSGSVFTKTIKVNSHLVTSGNSSLWCLTHIFGELVNLLSFGELEEITPKSLLIKLDEVSLALHGNIRIIFNCLEELRGFFWHFKLIIVELLSH